MSLFVCKCELRLQTYIMIVALLHLSRLTEWQGIWGILHENEGLCYLIDLEIFRIETKYYKTRC